MAKIGVLALQGAFEKHLNVLRKIGVACFEVRRPHELKECTGLILPGGESTTMWQLMEKNCLIETLKQFKKPIFGTCAGLILMGRLNLISVEFERNAYGRQSASFFAKVDSTFGPIPGLFIRAPRIRHISDDVEVLARHGHEPVLIRQANRWASTFHPELTEETTLHKHFVALTFPQADAEKS